MQFCWCLLQDKSDWTILGIYTNPIPVVLSLASFLLQNVLSFRLQHKIWNLYLDSFLLRILEFEVAEGKVGVNINIAITL